MRQRGIGHATVYLIIIFIFATYIISLDTKPVHLFINYFEFMFMS
jgi:hypothetical protein